VAVGALVRSERDQLLRALELLEELPGAPLARLEGRIALQTVFERWPAIHQAGELVYADNFNIRILRSLPVATSCAHRIVRNLGLRSFLGVCIGCNLRRPPASYVNAVF
jgi:hypothetical protein